jgi:hypothetical protein
MATRTQHVQFRDVTHVIKRFMWFAFAPVSTVFKKNTENSPKNLRKLLA